MTSQSVNLIAEVHFYNHTHPAGDVSIKVVQTNGFYYVNLFVGCNTGKTLRRWLTVGGAMRHLFRACGYK